MSSPAETKKRSFDDDTRGVRKKPKLEEPMAIQVKLEEKVRVETKTVTTITIKRCNPDGSFTRVNARNSRALHALGCELVGQQLVLCLFLFNYYT